MLGISAPVPINQESVRAELIGIGSVSTLDDRGGSDAQRQLGQDRWLEDALLAQQMDPLTLEREAPH